MITPTNGRVVHYINANPNFDSELYSDQPMTAFISYVHNDRCVNLGVLSDTGSLYGRTSVILVQPGDLIPEGVYCTWMPYQVKKSFGSESGESSVGTSVV